MTSRKQMAANGATPFLPEEIITDILKRLPVKSLIRFRCVCKHWKNLVQNPSFITDHLRYSGHQNPNFLFYHPSSYECEKTGELNLLNCKMQVRDLPKAPLFDYLWAGRFKIIGSSNGLLCVKIRRNEVARPPSSILLWNPATKDVRELPRSRTIDSCKFGCEFGFGFNSSLNDFKIVAIDDQIDRMGVYSLSRDSWKEIELKNFPEDFTFDETAVSSNEAIFWKGEIGGEEGKGVIVSFDTTKEVFTFIPWPTDTALNTSSSLYSVDLTVYKDKLAIFHSGGDGSLWVLEEDIGSSGERWNWTKKFIGGHYPRMFDCVGTIWRNEFVIVGNTETRGKEGRKIRLCLVNLTANEFKIIDGPPYWHAEFLNYVESLVPIFNNHWRPPPAGQIKINTDGAHSQYTSGVASGGLLRDEDSTFVRGFMFKGEYGDSLTAELWGCIHGLKIAWDLGYKDVILEIDSADAVDLIRSPSNSAHEDNEDRLLLDELKSVIDRHWNVDIHHISHWANAAADYLAKASLSSLPGFQIVLHADLKLEKILATDRT